MASPQLFDEGLLNPESSWRCWMRVTYRNGGSYPMSLHKAAPWSGSPSWTSQKPRSILKDTCSEAKRRLKTGPLIWDMDS